jgi:single-strand DNA-binding protein
VAVYALKIIRIDTNINFNNMSVNKVILVGRVGGDANIRTVGDQKVASFNLATSEKYKGKDGNVVEQTEWHSITIWGKLAEVVEKYVTKGTQLYIEGKIKTEKYTDNAGIDKYVTRILANTLQLLGSKSENQPAQQSVAPKVQYKTTPIVAGEDPGDDLPF